MKVYRDTPAIVLGGNGIVFIYNYVYGVAVPSHGFINGVVYHFIHQVVQPPDAYITYVHGRPFSNVFDPLQRLNTVGRIGAVFNFFVHKSGYVV